MEGVYVVVGTLSMRIQLNVDPESITTKVIWSFGVGLEFEFLEVFSSFLSTRKKSAWWCLSCATVAEWRHVSSSLVAHCDVLSSNDKNVVVPLNINQPNYLSSLPSLFAGLDSSWSFTLSHKASILVRHVDSEQGFPVFRKEMRRKRNYLLHSSAKTFLTLLMAVAFFFLACEIILLRCTVFLQRIIDHFVSF